MIRRSTPPSPPLRDTGPSFGDISRVAREIADRLRQRGVYVSDMDTPEELGALLDAVEEFEQAVEARGGDLMMDEGAGSSPREPDNPAFVLPMRHTDELAAVYANRVRGAARGLSQGTF